jgi:signal transduction histidine kinase
VSSIRNRIAFAFTGLALVVLAGGFAAYYLHARDALMELTDDALMARARSLAAAIERESAVLVLPDTVRRAEALSSRDPARGFVVRSEGASPMLSPWLENAPDVVSALDAVAPTSRSGVTIHPAGRGNLRAFHLRNARGGVALDVYVVEDLAEVEEELTEVIRGFLIALAPAALLAAVSAWLAARRISAPVVAIADAARRVESGDDTARIPQGGPDEVARLAETLQRSFDRIHAALARERRFTSDASHELRTPLAAILVDAEVTLGQPQDEGSYRKTLENVVAAAQRMQTTLESLLLLARFDAASAGIETRRADVAEALHEAAAAVGPCASERGVVIDLPNETAAAAAADPALLTTVFRNLFANGIEHGRQGGRVEARVRQEPGFVTVEIEDDGPGLAPDVLPRAFEPFVRGDPARGVGGAGLGLSIAKRIVEAFGGTIRLSSGPRGGALVVVRLPAAA